MAVSQTCSVPGEAVTLDVGARQQLRYNIKCDPGVVFQLRDHAETVLLPAANGPAPMRLWPVYPGEVPALDEVSHSLGMIFGASNQLEWLVELLDRDGALIRTIKHCKYRNPAGHEVFFDALSIFITGRS